MVFVETPVFTRRAQELLDEDSCIRLQRLLLANPEASVVIEGTGGIRKVRVPAKGRGKRSGARVIYYHFVQEFRIALLLVYSKNEQQDLSASERKALKSIVEGWSQA